MEKWIATHMSAHITEQFWLLVVSVFAGMLLCLIYDMFRGIRRVRKWKRQTACTGRWKAGGTPMCAQAKRDSGIVGFEDALFCICYVVLTYLVMYRRCDGVLAGYVLLGEVLGGLLYYRAFGNLIRLLWTILFWYICTIMMWILDLILFPFRVFCRKMIMFLKSLIKSVRMVIINN
jgi:hypothetical protein